MHESGNLFLGQAAKVYSGGLRESFVWAVSAKLKVALSAMIVKFKSRGNHTRAIPTARDLLFRKYTLSDLHSAVGCEGKKMWVRWVMRGYPCGNLCSNVIPVCCRPVTRGYACGYRCRNTFFPISLQRRSLQL